MFWNSSYAFSPTPSLLTKHCTDPVPSSTLKISKSDTNGLKEDSVILIFQLRAVDKKRIKNKLGELDENLMSKLDKLVVNMLKLN